MRMACSIFYFLNLVYMEGSEDDIINLSRHLIIIFAMLLCLLWLNNTKSFYQSILRFIIQFFFKLFRLFFICQKNTRERKKIKIEKNDFFIFNLCEIFFELNNDVVKESCKVALRLESEGGDDVIMRSFISAIVRESSGKVI